MNDRDSEEPILQPGFYWARRREGGILTVIEIVASESGEPWVQIIGNLNCPDVEEAKEYFEILTRIDEPVQS